MECKIEGTDKLIEKLKRNVKLEDAKRVVRNNGEELQRKAQRNAPVDTGALKESIGLEVVDNGLTAEVAPTVKYASYVEYGVRRATAQPYMHPAFNEQSAKFKSDMDKLTR